MKAKSDYFAKVVKITQDMIMPIEKADRIQSVRVDGYNCIIKKPFDDGLYLFFKPELELAHWYLEQNKLYRKDGGYFEDGKGRIKTVKMRGAWSDGLVMPLTSISEDFATTAVEDDTVDEWNGQWLTKKYIPLQKIQKEMPIGKQGKKKIKIKNIPEHSHTGHLADMKSNFMPGDIVQITAKAHGTSGRSAYTKITLPWYKKIWYKLLKKNEFVDIWASRRVEYKNDPYRVAIHNQYFKGKMKENEIFFYEICGYIEGTQRLIMGNCGVPKELQKKWGKTMAFTYGCQPGEMRTFLYRGGILGADGVKDYTPDELKARAEELGIETVIELDRFEYTDFDDLLARCEQYLDVPDVMDNSHIAEGCVIRNLTINRWNACKIKGPEFRAITHGAILESNEILDNDIAEEM